MGLLRRSICLVALAGGLLVGAGDVVPVRAEIPAAETPTIELGQDLYRRGYYAEAHDVWLELAQRGDRDAQYRLGALFHDGVVVPQDYEQAAAWYVKAAEAGNPNAQFDLATLYDMGAGVEQDLGKAAYWYMRAAKQGAPAGQYNMAVMYEDGVGIERDYPDSYFWYDQALRADFFDVRGQSRERVSAQMTIPEILDVHRRAKQWRPVVE